MLMRYAQSFIHQHEFICSEIKRVHAQREMSVEVCMTWGLLGFFPSDFLSRFVLKNPDISLTTRSYQLEECREAMLSYRGAVALYFGELKEPALETLFHREAPLCALMSADHPLAARSTLRLVDFQKQKLVLMNNDPGVTKNLQDELQSAGCNPQIVLDGMEWTQALEMISSAGYISFCLYPRDIKWEGLVVRPLEDLQLLVKFSMVKLKNIELSKAENRFVEYVIQRMTNGRPSSKK